MIRWGAWVSCLNPAYVTESRLVPLRPSRASLLAESSNSSTASIENTAIGHLGSAENTSKTLQYIDSDTSGIPQVGISQIGIIQSSLFQKSETQIGTSEICFTQKSLSQSSSIENSAAEINSSKVSFSQNSSTQITPTQIGSTKIGIQVSSSQPGFHQVNTTPVTPQSCSTQVNTAQNYSSQVVRVDIGSSEATFPLGITTDHLFNEQWDVFRHQLTSSINTYSKTSPWLSLFQASTLFNLNIEITDLPTGQLAEANITGFDPTGRPNSGTLYLDVDANGLGWYIDPTPWDNSEYSQTLTDTAYRATPDSAAYGHYDLLTTILHETAHLQGFISGYSNYDRHIQTQNGSKTFVGDSFSAILTPDGSHLNSQVYPYDLMNTTLTPGVRKLPSALDIAILNTLRQPTSLTTQPALLTAPLSAGALIAINNGSFDTNTDWYTRGDSQILNGQAVLSEDSPYLSHLSQTFVIPQGAKALQFTLVNTDLHSSNTRLAPGDAFEVALLNHTTNTSVLAPLTGLSQTDALLNIQSNGQTYTSNAVTLGGLSGAEPRTVQIDVSTLTPGTVVTLYFDLLGFGAKDSSVTIDDVQILSELSQAPIAQNDSATTNQNTAVTV